MTFAELKAAFERSGAEYLELRHKRSGKVYLAARDQLRCIEDDDGWGYGPPVDRKPRDKLRVRWYAIKNMTLAN